MTTSAPLTIAALDVSEAAVLADLARLRDRLVASQSPELIEQAHQFCDIDPDIANRTYLPFAHTHPAVAR